MARKQYSQRFSCLLTEREIKRCVEVTQPITKKITDSHRSAEPVLRNRSTVLSRSVVCCLYDGAEATETTATDDRRSFVRSGWMDFFSYFKRARFAWLLSGVGWPSEDWAVCTQQRVGF